MPINSELGSLHASFFASIFRLTVNDDGHRPECMTDEFHVAVQLTSDNLEK